MSSCAETFIIQLGAGKVGSPLARLLFEHREHIADDSGVRLRYGGILRSNTMTFGDDGARRSIEQGSTAADWTTREPGLSLDALNPIFDRFGQPSDTHYLMVDATATSETASILLEALGTGIPVVTANKIPLAEIPGWFDHARAASRRTRAPFRYGCTVGGSLPVISTLHDLLETGDTVLAVTALCSSSLSCIMGNVNRGVTLERAIADAAQRGFAEPDPLVDLAGRDALRKMVILAKTVGMAVSMEDVEQEPLLDRTYIDFQDFRDHGMERLTERLQSARRPGNVSYYVGIIEAGAQPVLAMHSYPDTSVWGTLEPSENLFLFSTSRFGDVPVSVRGTGGGPLLTASGVLADIIKAAQVSRW